MLAEDVEGHEDFWLRFQATGAQSLMDYFHQSATLRELRLRHWQPLRQVKLETEQIVQYNFFKMILQTWATHSKAKSGAIIVSEGHVKDPVWGGWRVQIVFYI